jgi:hypothetical protein
VPSMMPPGVTIEPVMVVGMSQAPFAIFNISRKSSS